MHLKPFNYHELCRVPHRTQIVSLLDQIFRWCSLRLIDDKAQSTMKVQELLNDIFDALLANVRAALLCIQTAFMHRRLLQHAR